MSLSVIIPTYKEVANIKKCTQSIAEALAPLAIDYEIVYMDDNSNDGSLELVESLQNTYPVKMIVRQSDRGLSKAVIEGFRHAQFEYVIVMDADLSHPASALPALLEKLQQQPKTFVIGSRYVKGGQLDDSWGLLRRIISKVATYLARPLVKVSDPMSGFFGIRKADIPAEHLLSPVGYKIGLEVLVKGAFTDIYEHPIRFIDRQEGQSKMSLLEQIRYLRHLRRLYQYKYTIWSEVVQFASVGSSGFIVDLSFYLFLQAVFGLPHQLARGLSFWPAVSWNWLLNRALTFSHRDKRPKLRQWMEFVLSSLFGFVINVGSYFLLTTYVPLFQDLPIFALVIGILLGMGFNFIFSSFFVFRLLRDDEANDHP